MANCRNIAAPSTPHSAPKKNAMAGMLSTPRICKTVAPCGIRPKREEPEDSPHGDPVIATIPMSPSSQVKQILYRRWFPECNHNTAVRTTGRGTFPKSPIGRCCRLLIGTNETATYESNDPPKNILLTSDRWSTRTESRIAKPPRQPQRQGSCRHLTNESMELFIQRLEAPF